MTGHSWIALPIIFFRRSKSADHKNQLAQLEEKDPEFFKFLKENDKELLDFNDSDTGSEVESDDDDEEDDDDESKDSKDDKKDKKVGIFAWILSKYIYVVFVQHLKGLSHGILSYFEHRQNYR